VYFRVLFIVLYVWPAFCHAIIKQILMMMMTRSRANLTRLSSLKKGKEKDVSKNFLIHMKTEDTEVLGREPGLFIHSIYVVVVITQEKTMQNIEGFDKSKLKHAATAEKVVLPDEQGKCSCFHCGLNIVS